MHCRVCPRILTMNPAIHLSPRIAMVHTAVQLLPHFTSRPLGELPDEERKGVLRQAVSTAREIMKLCNYDRDALTTADLRETVAGATGTQPSASRPEWIRMPTKGRCPHTGLSRSMLYMLTAPCAENGHRPPVRSISLRRK